MKIDLTVEATILGICLMFAASLIDINVNVYVGGEKVEVTAGK